MFGDSTKFFITGTGTGVGKTYVTCAIMRYLTKLGKSVVAMKPVATGGIPTEINREIYNLNEDVAELHKHINYAGDLSYEIMSPFSFIEPISPNIASAGIMELDSDIISEKILSFIDSTNDADYHIIEGVGGWHVPINSHETMADVVYKTKLPVILVVGMTLGCMNHAILTYRAMRSMNIEILGWVPNHIDKEMLAYQENLNTLTKFIDAPCIEIYCD